MELPLVVGRVSLSVCEKRGISPLTLGCCFTGAIVVHARGSTEHVCG